LLIILFCITSCQPKKEVVIAPDEILLNHRFTNLQGKPVDIKQYLGKPLLINYWATWCKYCLKDLPVVQQFVFKKREEIKCLRHTPTARFCLL